MREPLDELLDLTAAPVTAALRDIARAELARDPVARDAAVTRLARLLRQTLILSDLLGRSFTLAEADAAVAAPSPFADELAPLVPAVEFEQAIRDILTREPRLARSAEEVARSYSEERSFALARSAELTLTKRVQEVVAETARTGGGSAAAETVIAGLGGWTRAYGETVYRTNLATAYTAGRWREAASPGVSRVMSAFEVSTAGDADVRDGRNDPENHAAADGLIAGTTDPVWDRASPPYGYRCRCSLRLVSRYELEELGLLRPDGSVIARFPPSFGAFRPHPNFGRRRPDVAVYG